MTKAHVRYLEGRLINLTNQSGRATLANGTSPTIGGLPDADKNDMDYFLAQVQILLPVLNILFTTPAPKITPSEVSISLAGDNIPTLPVATPLSSPNFELKTGNAQGDAQEINNHFIVAQGALANSKETTSLGKTYRQLRDRYRANGTLADDPTTDKWILTSDTTFTSPTAAAAVLCGYPVNGRIMWKIKDSTETYATWQDSFIQQITTSSEQGKL